jgi:parallel beta-helix repeat protein
LKIALFSLTVCFLLSVSAAGWTAKYYVDKNHTNASDSNPGTASQPWRTIRHAAGTVVAGDTVYVKNGTYYESSEVRFNNSGSEGFPIIIRSYQGHRPIIDGSKTSAGKFIHARGKNYIIFDGFEVRNASQYGIWFDGNYNIIRNCKVHNNGRSGSANGIILKAAVGGGLYNTITNCEIYSNSWNGISVESCKYTTISYNTVYANHHQGINVFPRTDQFTGYEDGNDILFNKCFWNTSSGIYTRYQRNNIIANNVVYENDMWGIMLHGGGTGNPGRGNSYTSNTKVLNNTIVDNNFDGLFIHTGTHVTVKNNLFYKNNHAPAYPSGDGKANIRIEGIIGCIINNNFYVEYPNTTGPFYYSGSKSLSQWQALGFDKNIINEGTPGFVSLKNNDYSLMSSSDAVDEGTDVASYGITKDIKGTLRPQKGGFDIGAYELNSGDDGGKDLPTPPSNLKIISSY